MRGLDRVISMRRSGFKPACVTLEPDCQSLVVLQTWVQYEKKDVPELFDLRPLVGLLVAVIDDDEGLAKRWAQAACRAGASTVTAIFGKQSHDFRINGVDL